MTAVFTKKKIEAPPARLCLRLKEIRTNKNISLEEIAQKTKIDKKYLQYIEDCRFDLLPRACVYQKNFLRRYVSALGLEPEPFLNQYLIEEATPTKKPHPRLSLKKHPWANLPFFFRYSFLVLLVFFMVGYLGWQVKKIIEPPVLAILSPIEGFITTKDQILILGETEKETAISINGREAMNNENGQFKETINLSPGVNTITVSAKKKHGKTTIITRHIVFKKNQELTLH